MFDRDDRVGIVRDRRTGHDPDGMAGVKRRRCSGGGGDLTPQRQTAWCPRKVGHTDGEAVHL
jgi:hypothetical protein